MRRFALFVRVTTTILTKSHKIGLRNGGNTLKLTQTRPCL
jgi:hypothetical protein